MIGARSFVATRAVLPAVDDTDGIELVAAASNSGSVPDPWGGVAVDTYSEVIAHPGVDAVYIPLPNGLHEEWTARAAAAGKHVLCEKPLATNPATAERMFTTCREAGVILAEAWMTPFGDRWAAGVECAARGDIGTIERVDAAFTFTIGPEAATNYRWDPAQGGGALADVGIYCLGPAVALFGSTPDAINAHAAWTPRGVDASIDVTLTWANGHIATARCSFVDEESQLLTIVGSDGTITLDDEPHTGGDPYRPMIAAFAAAARGDQPWPRSPTDTLALTTLIDRIARSARATDDDERR